MLASLRQNANYEMLQPKVVSPKKVIHHPFPVAGARKATLATAGWQCSSRRDCRPSVRAQAAAVEERPVETKDAGNYGVFRLEYDISNVSPSLLWFCFCFYCSCIRERFTFFLLAACLVLQTSFG